MWQNFYSSSARHDRSRKVQRKVDRTEGRIHHRCLTLHQTQKTMSADPGLVRQQDRAEAQESGTLTGNRALKICNCHPGRNPPNALVPAQAQPGRHLRAAMPDKKGNHQGSDRIGARFGNSSGQTQGHQFTRAKQLCSRRVAAESDLRELARREA